MEHRAASSRRHFSILVPGKLDFPPLRKLPKLAKLGINRHLTRMGPWGVSRTFLNIAHSHTIPPTFESNISRKYRLNIQLLEHSLHRVLFLRNHISLHILKRSNFGQYLPYWPNHLLRQGEPDNIATKWQFFHGGFHTAHVPNRPLRPPAKEPNAQRFVHFYHISIGVWYSLVEYCLPHVSGPIAEHYPHCFLPICQSCQYEWFLHDHRTRLQHIHWTRCRHIDKSPRYIRPAWSGPNFRCCVCAVYRGKWTGVCPLYHHLFRWKGNFEAISHW